MQQVIPDSTDDTINRGQRQSLLVTTVTGHGLKHLFSAAILVLLPELKIGLGLTNTQIGTLATVRSIAGGVANLPAGFMADRFAPQRAEILGASIAFVGVFAFMLGASPNYWLALFAMALFTIAITFWHPAAISSLSRNFENRRGFAIALHGAGGSIGEALGPALTGLLLVYVGWRIVLQGMIVPGILCGVLIWLLLRPIPTGEDSSSKISEYLVSMIGLIRNGRLLLVLLFAGGFAGGQGTIMTFLPIYLREDFGVSPLAVGLYLSLAHVGGIVSQPLLGLASDRFGRKAILAPSLGILGLAALGLYFAPQGILFGLVVLIMGIFLFPLMAILLASASDLVEGNMQATTVSLVFGAGIVVSGFMPAIAGIIADAVNVKATFLLGFGVLVVTSLLAFVTRWDVTTVKDS